MSSPYGHIKLSRKLFDGDPWWGETRAFSRFEAWVDMLQLAAWRPVGVTYQGEIMSLGRGEFVLSVRLAARRWGWSPKSARTFLKQAQQAARIKAQREAQAGTVYLIVNYDSYQGSNPPKGTGEDTPKGTAKGTVRAQRGHTEGTARAQEEAVKQGSREAGKQNASAPDESVAPKETWLTPFFDVWTRRVGVITPKRLATHIAPVRAAFGDEATLKGMHAYIDEAAGDPNRPLKIEWFKGDAARWVKEGAEPIVRDGDLTPRGLRLAGVKP